MAIEKMNPIDLLTSFGEDWPRAEIHLLDQMVQDYISIVFFIQLIELVKLSHELLLWNSHRQRHIQRQPLVPVPDELLVYPIPLDLLLSHLALPLSLDFLILLLHVVRRVHGVIQVVLVVDVLPALLGRVVDYRCLLWLFGGGVLELPWDSHLLSAFGNDLMWGFLINQLFQ